MATISWHELGEPTSPGDIRIPDLGIVKIGQDNIKAANGPNAGKAPAFELIEATAFGNDVRTYVLGLMV